MLTCVHSLYADSPPQISAKVSSRNKKQSDVFGKSFAIGGSSTYFRKMKLKIHPDKFRNQPSWIPVATYFCARFGEWFNNIQKDWTVACKEDDEEEKREVEDLNKFYIEDASRALKNGKKMDSKKNIDE